MAVPILSWHWRVVVAKDVQPATLCVHLQACHEQPVPVDIMVDIYKKRHMHMMRDCMTVSSHAFAACV